ncbi:uncharacterized protein B0T15DRAFT_123852 [Chaetomium strumarium]|uniref:Uncharacterized protein n=1 Tax=Chaetomium strumarium TaxID=1170767 RepID=A0AAJ0GZF3_9PEZI|nr:hypothetical protein B0T15DRAFT_123852 [Chaetomium strumarium]
MDPLKSSLPPAPPISLRTMQMAGLLVDVYGLSELPPTATHISCLWLHHPRTKSKETMGDFAARCVAAWYSNSSAPGPAAGGAAAQQGPGSRGLVALAYDQRNHGSRAVDEKANGSWREGNAMHAVDMFGVIAGMVADQRVLLDLVEGYLLHDDTEGKRTIDQHLALGVSLGGHSVWQLMFAEPRVTAGVVVIGCPDYMNLLSDRARLSKLATYSAQDKGASFFGSKDFPPSLVEACKKFDPKGILLGTSAVPDVQSSGVEEEPARRIAQTHLRGKKFLLCSGGDDKLVPYRCSEPFLKWFKQATETWLKEERVSVDDRVYPGIGHTFSKDMVTDAVSFIVDAVANAERSASASGGDEQRTSKI